MKTLLFFLVCFISFGATAQQRFRAVIMDSAVNGPLAGATVKAGTQTTVANEEGMISIANLPSGTVQMTFSFSGYQTRNVSFLLPDTSLHKIYLQREPEALENVTVSTTRTAQRIENSPLKVEVLGREEMDEENTIKPGNIASILGDVSGIQIQQSSAISGNAAVRIQGLEGRYTQILRDGMPLFEGFSGGFGILQIPPLDLRQIELIKGSASTLYGGGAIGGLINLISKRPSTKQEAEVTLNQTTLKESNLNTYIAKRANTVGYTFFGGFTHQGLVDVNNDGFSDVPKLDAVILHPRLFLYPSQKTTVAIGYTGTFETREGGDVQVVNGKPDAVHQFFENNRSQRHTADAQVQFTLPANQRIDLKAVGSSFTRSIATAAHYFKGRQRNYYTELSHSLLREKYSLVSGLTLAGDDFGKLPSDPVLFGDFSNTTAGAFSQLTLNFSERTVTEAGLRFDHHNQYGNFVLPRVAVFHRFSDAWAARAGLGLGYKTPNVLAQQTIDYDIEDIQPLPSDAAAEKSVGYNAEVNYRKEFGNGSSLFINQAFFLTRLNNPVVPNVPSNGQVQFINAGKNITSKGFDTYVKAEMHGWELYAGYTLTVAERAYLSQNKFVPLTPKNRFAFVIVHEIGEQWRFGLEGSYTGKQHRYDYTQTPGYLFLAAVVARNIGDRFTVVLNCENLADYRQSREEALYTGTITAPVFKPLWAPIDGRVANLSVRLKLAKK